MQSLSNHALHSGSSSSGLVTHALGASQMLLSEASLSPPTQPLSSVKDSTHSSIPSSKAGSMVAPNKTTASLNIPSCDRMNCPAFFSSDMFFSYELEQTNLLEEPPDCLLS